MTKIKLPMPTYNCFAECDVEQADNPRYKNAHVDSRMEPLLAELGRKRPQWHFITYRQGTLDGSGTYADHTCFRIEEDGEMLGELWIDRNWRTGESSFCMHNDRLRRQRERSGPTKTIHLKKAIKLVLDNYVASTITEIASRAMATVRGAVTSEVSNAAYAFRDCMDSIRPALAEYLVNRPEVMAQVRQLCTKPEKLDKMPEAYEHKKAVDAMQLGDGVTIITARGKYIATNDGGDLQEYTSDTLPDNVRQGVGMLKLVGPKTLVPGVGMRVDENIFFIANQGE